jgi:hypothetical protein
LGEQLTDPEFDALIARARAAFAALTPEEQSAHLRAQRISWVIGELLLSNDGMTREKAAELAKRAVADLDAEEGR